MKIEFVEIAGFRGFRDKVRFNLPSGFAVLTGRNGVGKSTMLDAIDFALTGTINKYSVRKSRGGGIDDHIWWVGNGTPAAHYVSVGFVGDDGEKYVVTRDRDHNVPPFNVMSLLCHKGAHPVSPETLMQTTLIRDEFIVAFSLDLPEQARFAAVRDAIGRLVGPDYSKRTTDIYEAAKRAKEAQERRLDAAQNELGRALSALTETRSAADRSPDVAEALKTIADFSLPLPADQKERAVEVRTFVAERRRALREIEEARVRYEAVLPELSYLGSPQGASERNTAAIALATAQDGKAEAEKKYNAAIQSEKIEQDTDAFAAHLLALVEHGSALGLQDGHCPLCDALRSTEEFDKAISSAKARIATSRVRLDEAAAVVREARAALDQADRTLLAAQNRAAQLQQRKALADRELATIEAVFRHHGFMFQADNLVEMQNALLAEQENIARLERALFILEASTAVDRIATMEAKVASLRSRIELEESKLTDSEKATDSARQIDASAKTVANQMLAEQFDTVMPLLKELYRRLRPHAEWLEIESDFGGKVRGSLNFVVGGGHNVQFLFSSGQRRAAGLAFLLAIHLARRWCSWQTLLLDDPVQHVDDYRALNLVEVLSAIRRTNRQIIVAVEDAALADVLCRRLRSSIDDIGRRFELHTGSNGSAEIARIDDIYPMPREVLRPAQAS